MLSEASGSKDNGRSGQEASPERASEIARAPEKVRSPLSLNPYLVIWSLKTSNPEIKA